MRTQEWLEQIFNDIWQEYFADIPRRNDVYVRYGPRVRKRLGSIRACNRDHSQGTFDTLILINGHFRDEYIPEYVVKATIAHELCHYAHGFSSPLPQLSRYPHRGGLVDEEMRQRNLDALETSEHCWLCEHWLSYLSRYRRLHPAPRRARRNHLNWRDRLVEIIPSFPSNTR